MRVTIAALAVGACTTAMGFIPSTLHPRTSTTSKMTFSARTVPAARKGGLSMSLAEPPTAVSVGKAAAASKATSQKKVYLFNEGDKDMRMLLGGKGANLCEMSNLGLPVPPGFIITTDNCIDFFQNGSKGLTNELRAEYLVQLTEVEKQLNKKFGDKSNPLLLSVRSGAPASMPGMMDTVLNLGLNDEIAAALIEKTGNERWVLDTHRRFLSMFGSVVMGLDGEKYEHAITQLKAKRGVKLDIDLTVEDLKELIATYKAINPDVPNDPYKQLDLAIQAVFKSWYNPRAVRYRSYNGIPSSWGTAVTVQSMVFGNLDDKSGVSATGVAFTRNPATGEKEFFGEFLENAAGEDVVAGTRTPHPISDLKAMHPGLYDELWDLQLKLENHYRDMQDLEFTIENGRLFMLQCRSGKRTPKAAVRIAVDQVNEGLITKQEALLRIPASQMDFFLHSSIDPKAKLNSIATGLPAGPGAVTGKIVLTAEEAEEAAERGESVILVRHETSAEDIHGMRSAVGILTKNGGMTSHAAVVARGMGKTCVCGCNELHIDLPLGIIVFGEGHDAVTLHRGDVITLDGTAGRVLLGEVPRVKGGQDEHFSTILKWADENRRLKIKTNADTPEDAIIARQLGAEGIGLCRSEHMFFEPTRISVMRVMILATDLAERQRELNKLYDFQLEDFKGIFNAMDGLPVTIRLLDPPLHEFLPRGPDALAAMAREAGKSILDVESRMEELEEVNPMLGFRGCRLSIVHPEITVTQVKAIMNAALEVKKAGGDPRPEIMVPVVGSRLELRFVFDLIEKTIKEVFEEAGATIPYKLGSMMELPRACLKADKFAEVEQLKFISFGTNDLTQTTWGLSRDDMSSFQNSYVYHGVLEGGDPFATVDEDGVGQLINIALKKALSVNPDLEKGICGEHGGDPHSIDFFHRAGLDYVSCSPFRVPIARIAAAQANINSMMAASEWKGVTE